MTVVVLGGGTFNQVVANDPIQHDAEHYVLLHQYKDKWDAEDRELDQKLTDLRAQNGGKKPGGERMLNCIQQTKHLRMQEQEDRGN